MLYFSNAKINLGLHVTEKRTDGYHNLETIFYPIQTKDALEFIESNEMKLDQTGLVIDIPIEQNLMVKAYRILQNDFDLPPLHFHIHKTIPSGAGLGGGSANAAASLIAINQYFNLGLDRDKLHSYAAQLGADCAFFIKNSPVYATGKGDEFQSISLDLSPYYIWLIRPDFGISTAQAYGRIVPQKPEFDLRQVIAEKPENWENRLKNDFETHLFSAFPKLVELKAFFYSQGALYSAMSGSGSTVFGIFDHYPQKEAYSDFWQWKGALSL